MTRTLITAIAFALVVVACGGGADGADDPQPTTTTTTAPAGPPTMVLQITDEGGFAPVEFVINRLPRFTLYSDGSVYFQGPVPEIFPGPLWPNVLVANIGEQGLTDVHELVEAIGLPSIVDEVNDEAARFVADATTTVITYVDEAGEHRFSIYALGLAEITDPRAGHLLRLMTVLDTYANEAPEQEPYTPGRVQVLVQEAPFIDPQFGVVEPWIFDFDPTAIAPAVLEFSCTVLEGDEATAAIETFLGAHQQTFWDRGGTVYQLLPRPLLPGEEGCAFGN